MSVDPIILEFGPRIRRVVNWLEGKSLIRHGAADFPALARYEDGYAEICFAHLYPRFEPVIIDYLKFKDVHLGDYQLIFKHAAFTRVMRHLVKFSQLEEVLEDLVASESRMLGLPFDFCDLYARIYGHELPVGFACGRYIRRIVNFGLVTLVMVSVLVHILRSVRLGSILPHYAPLGADLAEEGRVRDFFNQIANVPEEIYFVVRNQGVCATLDDTALAKYTHLELNDGQLTIIDAVSVLFQAFSDLCRIYLRLSWLSPHVFAAVAKQVRKRVQFRAFFNKHQFQGFLARDEYNTDHITRTQELRRAGIRSLGLTHGMATGPRIYPHNRFLDYDVLYVFGRCQYQMYGDTWPKKMEVKPIGCYSLSREQISRLGTSTSKDIVIFCNQVTDNKKFIQTVTEIARTFNDRHVYIKLKYPANYVGVDLHESYMQMLGDLPANVEVVIGSPYELMMKAGYAISGLSTAVAEAVQMGLVSFFVDSYKADQDIMFRAFPELCRTSAEGVITCIRQIEAGEWTYPREKFADLIDLSGANPFDVIRADLGLPAWSENHHCR